ILHERLPDLDLAFLKAVVRDLNSENLWGVDGGPDPAIEQFTADLNMKLGNLPVAPPPKDVLEPRFVDAALKQLGPWQKKYHRHDATAGAARRHGRLPGREQILSGARTARREGAPGADGGARPRRRDDTQGRTGYAARAERLRQDHL